MADIPKIPAVIPSLPTASKIPALNLPAAGASVEAKVAQILSDGLVQLTSSLGKVELLTSGPPLEVGASVRLAVTQDGDVTITLPSATPASPQQAATTATLSNLAFTQAQLSTTTAQGTVPAAQSSTPQSVASNVTPPVVAASQANTTSALLNSSLQEASSPQAQPQPTVTPQTLSGAVQPQQNTTNAPALPLTAQLVAAQQDLPTGSVVQNTAPVTVATNVQQTPVVPASLTDALHEAFARQTSLAPLVANLDYVARNLRRNVPEQLRNAIDNVLNTLVPIEKLSAATLEKALHQSGVFQESTLAQLAEDGASSQLIQPDLKSTLLKLTSLLQNLPREDSADGKPQINLSSQKAQQSLETQKSEQPSIRADSTQAEIVDILTQQTGAALSRLRVLQFSSLPTAAAPDADPQIRPAQNLHIDLPLLLPNQTAVIPLQIERDPERKDAKKHERRWRVRFTFNLTELGSIHALLAFGAGLVNVTLWAEQPHTFQIFKADEEELRGALSADTLDIGSLEVRAGSPHSTVPAGSLLDTRT